MRNAQFAFAATVASLVLGACAKAPSGPPTYYKDVAPLLEEKCGSCHVEGGIGPFAMTLENAQANKAIIRADVAAKIMPPWLANTGCQTYSNDRSLTDDQINTITGWIDANMPLGNASDAPKAPAPSGGLTKVDFSMSPPGPYTPVERPDEYRCYTLTWPETTTTYVTGFNIRPGDAKIVHHVVAFIESPEQAAAYQAADAADPLPGYACFGGPGVASAGIPSLLGVWAPGSNGIQFPAGTGIMMPPGAVVVMQVHYNTTSVPPAPDQSTMDIELATGPVTPAVIMPYTSPVWLTTENAMTIPAGAPDQEYSFAYDVSQALSAFSNDAMEDGLAFNIYMVGLHMHWLGTHTSTSIQHADGSETCLLDINAWNFNWQSGYNFDQSIRFNPGDKLNLDCHWDNSAANQHEVNGVQPPPQTVNWGEDSANEMCMAFYYITQ